MKCWYSLDRAGGIATANLSSPLHEADWLGPPETKPFLGSWWAEWLKTQCRLWLPPSDSYLIAVGRAMVRDGFTRAQIVPALREQGALQTQAVYCASMAFSYGKHA